MPIRKYSTYKSPMVECFVVLFSDTLKSMMIPQTGGRKRAHHQCAQVGKACIYPRRLEEMMWCRKNLTRYQYWSGCVDCFPTNTSEKCISSIDYTVWVCSPEGEVEIRWKSYAIGWPYSSVTLSLNFPSQLVTLIERIKQAVSRFIS